MTGIEAVSNGVQAFREPRVRNARFTLIILAALLVYLLSIWRRLGKVGRELDELSRRIAERERRA